MVVIYQQGVLRRQQNFDSGLRKKSLGIFDACILLLGGRIIGDAMLLMTCIIILEFICQIVFVLSSILVLDGDTMCFES